MSDLVSLVMPVWRPRREWLLEAVGSALGQRDCSLELIVVDDGNAEPVAVISNYLFERRGLRDLRLERDQLHGLHLPRVEAGKAAADLRGQAFR